MNSKINACVGFHQCKIAQRKVFEQIKDDSEVVPAVPISKFKVDLPLRKEVASKIIGTGGSTIRAIRNDSSANIELRNEEVRGHRPCLISGVEENLVFAEILIYTLTQEKALQKENDKELSEDEEEQEEQGQERWRGKRRRRGG